MKSFLTRPCQYQAGLLRFPRDEGRHKYLVEWWYANFHVTGLSSGKKYGVMVAYFNNGMRLACITDESGEDYLYSARCFAAIFLPHEIEEAVEHAA